MRQILLVQDKSELTDVLEAELTAGFETLHQCVQITTSGNEQNARSHLPGDFDLVITPLNIRKTPLEPIMPDAERGLELLRWVNAGNMNKRSILIASVSNDRQRDLQTELKTCCVVQTSGHMVQEIVQRAQEMIMNAPTKCLDIEIQLQSENVWKYKVAGNGFLDAPMEQELFIEGDTRKSLLEASISVANSGDRNLLHSIGRTLRDALLGRRDFFQAIIQGLARVGDETNARVCFAVRQETQIVALEALLCPKSGDERHWGLLAPVYRRLLGEPSASVGGLFQGGKPIDCLIVDAPTSGLIRDLNMMLPELTKATEECTWLEDFLKQQKAAREHSCIGTVMRLPDPQSPKPFCDQLKEALKKEWGILHFAGHSYYDDKLAKGYLFYPGTSGPDWMDMLRFSDLLPTVTFTYFSSCKSGAGPFVFALANRRVPNILGFRWPIKDTWAYQHMQAFYTNLFIERSLERAYLKARQEVHKLQAEDDPSWAASILIKQVDEN